MWGGQSGTRHKLKETWKGLKRKRTSHRGVVLGKFELLCLVVTTLQIEVDNKSSLWCTDYVV